MLNHTRDLDELCLILDLMNDVQIVGRVVFEQQTDEEGAVSCWRVHDAYVLRVRRCIRKLNTWLGKGVICAAD